MSDDPFEQLERTAQKICALIDHLQADNKRLRAENERLSADGIHTCHDQCPRYACVLRRERDAALADVEQLRDENKRLRELVEGMEEELKEIGAVSWRTPDQKAVDADLMREDAHERKRLENEYPWKE